jgi:insertion element IS1 protein InsB
LYAVGKASFNMLAYLFQSWPSLIYRWIVDAGLKMPEPILSKEITEIEFDEMWHFRQKKNNKTWIIKAIDRCTGKTIAWVIGQRDEATFKRLYMKIAHLDNCLFFTDAWRVFAKVLPPERHVIGKKYTAAIERDNSNTRHHVGRFTRRTKVVSKSNFMINLTMKIWCIITSMPNVFKQYQQDMLCIFR